TGDDPAYPRFIPPGGPSRPWQLIRFRHFIDSSLALASLNRTCRDHRPGVSAALTTVAFDQSGPRWLGISDLITEPEGPTFISYKVARSRLDRLRFVTQDPRRTCFDLDQSGRAPFRFLYASVSVKGPKRPHSSSGLIGPSKAIRSRGANHE